MLTGSGFTGATAVSFGIYAATSSIISSDTQLTAVAPPHAAGTKDITVTNPGGTSGTSSSDTFTYNQAQPTVSAVSPNMGPASGGTVVLVTGTYFTGVTGVTFGANHPATTFIFLTDSAVVATSPAGTGTVDIRVTTYGGTSATSGSDQFTYQGGSGPMVSGHGPGAGAEGTASLPVSGDPLPAVGLSLASFGGVTEMTAPPASEGLALVSPVAAVLAATGMPDLVAPNGSVALPTLADRPAEAPVDPAGAAVEAGTGSGWVVRPTVGLEGSGWDRSGLDGYFAELGTTLA